MYGLIDSMQLLSAVRAYADHWWLWLLLIAVQIILYTFALTGSSMIWIIAALYPPLSSTLIFTTGTSLGALSAYLFSARLSAEWRKKVEGSRAYTVLQKQGGFLTLLSLRTMPGFPHSLVNYSSGLLNIRMRYFIPAVIAGSVLKAYIYSALIHNATRHADTPGSIDFSDLWPLMLISFSLLAIVLLLHIRDSRH